MNNGWVCLHRKFLDWEWYDDPNTMRLMIHCLLRANYEDTSWRGQPIKRGQFITSYAKLSEELGLSVKAVRVALDKLKGTGEVASKSNSKNTVITVTNYHLYQDRGKLWGEQGANEGQARGKPGATDNNNNNNNNKTNKQSKGFTPPTLEQITEYCKGRNSTVSPSKFRDHYEANGWYRGKNKVRDWKACIRTWESNDKKEGIKSRADRKPLLSD